MKVHIGEVPMEGEREHSIQIDPWDTWNMDVTLAEIILPMLKQWRKSAAGNPHVVSEWVPTLPENLQDASNAEKWDWVYGEILFAFETIVNGVHTVPFETLARVQQGCTLFGMFFMDFWE
jgi:hypothetical protein